MKITKEVKAAIIVVLGISCFFIGFNFLKSNRFLGRNNQYIAVFEHSNGLKAGTAVTINGVKVGNVDAVTIDEKTAKVVVKISCATSFAFSKNSKAEIYSSMLGGAGMQLVPAFDNAPMAKSGDTLVASVQQDMLSSLQTKLEPTQLKVDNLLTDTNQTVKSINDVFDEKTIAQLKATIVNLNATMQYLSQSSVALNQLLVRNQAALEGTLQNAHKMTSDLALITNSLAKADAAKVVENAQKSVDELHKIIAEIQKGQGSLGKLMKDESLYNNLDASSKQLELLLEDFRLNPKRYVHFSIFGRKNQPYQTQETQTEK